MTNRLTPRTVVLLVAILGVLALAVGALAYTVTHRDSDAPAVVALPPVATTVTTTTAPTTTTTTPPVTTTTTTTSPPIPSPDQFVRDLYGSLPGNTDQAWAMFGESYAASTGRANFEQFWSTIRSVSVLSVTSRSDGTVVARLRYVTNSGRVDTENRSVTTVVVQGKMLVDDSIRLGPA